MRNVRWSGLSVVLVAALVTGGVVGYLVGRSQNGDAYDPYATGLTGPLAEAAIVEAQRLHPEVTDPIVTRVVVIWADDDGIDTRTQVMAAGFCYWYGVQARIEDGGLVWHAGEAASCNADSG